MAKTAKKHSKDFVIMEHTRALLGEVWDQWRNKLGHTPEMAQRMMNAAIKEFHKDEKDALREFSAKKKTVKTAVKKTVAKKVATAKKTVKRKLKIACSGLASVFAVTDLFNLLECLLIPGTVG
jgi:hypothetical protein